ncbi:MAG: S-adenosylmethionine decarboxylase proenzyme [Parcubacteria group bacterium GW2011_GWA2_36_10]|nr:MAG: S-adenosylmethionine decarboxylase proenzyme [Parcubacteria group bacterium GW2011_GWA2_36_10]
MEQTNTCNFGEHLTIDGYQGSEEKLNNQALVLNCLNELPSLLGMHHLAAPEVYFAKGNDLKDPGGWSGFVVIEESHISIHTFPAKHFVSIDAYTCRNGMDCDFIVNYFKKVFDLKEVETNFIKRGTHFPL